ncbi:MAG: AbrB/MazE/SpoVT family DNA-binding domain-containing protein [Armatimonadaceae bacterium]|jgi:antitoxin component of MazEF toxin-antitoxin module
MDNNLGDPDLDGVPVRVVKWGNSLGIRIPALLVRETSLREGDWLAMSCDATGNLRLIRPPEGGFDRAEFVRHTDGLRAGDLSESAVEEVRRRERF